MDPQLECGQPEVQSRPTYAELLTLVAELRAELKEARETIRLQAEKIVLLEEEIKLLKKKLYGASSEHKPRTSGQGDGSGKKPKDGPPQTRSRSLTEQYPRAEVEDQYIGFDHAPQCQCCHRDMIDSGLTEMSEQLHTIPAKHKIVRKHRRKYKCTRCFGGLLTAPLPPRIAPGSSLGDSFIIEAAIAKFYNLMPSERYAGTVSYSGLENFPPQLVLAAQHYLADFLRPVYLIFRKMIQAAKLLHADETPHLVLEGEQTQGWYLWGFCIPGVHYFEIHPTRSGAVATDFLKDSSCVFLMSDRYVGYDRAIGEVNAIRKAAGLAEIIPLYCNAHSRRKFIEAAVSYPDEAQFYIDQYAKIYKLDAELKMLTDPISRLKKRAQMKPFFEAMALNSHKIRDRYSDRSSLVKAIDYFMNNFAGLTRFLADPALPIDNNIAERQLRSPVIGRKTWYGTHSERGNETTEILFTIMQTCRLVKVDPRGYLQAVTQAMLRSDPPFTPSQYREIIPDKKVA